KTSPGIGRILALTILYEIGAIERFETLQQLIGVISLCALSCSGDCLK
ncbi:MAG: IS110 family transposase, partial [Gammaproteobacteria bacterium]|nr:IS110 family transposase [Gammaproteobacteria bacterium]